MEDGKLGVVLQLMKKAREARLMEFFSWLAEAETALVEQLSDGFITLALLYALHADDTLDIETIAHTVRHKKSISRVTMNAVEKLIAKGEAKGEAKGKAEGKAEGEEQGYWIGRIQLLEEFLGLELTPKEVLSTKTSVKLKEKYEALQIRYDENFKK